MRDQGGDNFCPPGYGKVNRGIWVKPKTGFRCLEEAAVGEFSPSEEGSKPLCLISSHSKVFLELRHGTGTGPPFPTYLCWPRAQLLHWHWRKKPKQPRGWKPLFQNTVSLSSVLRTFPQQRTCSWAHTLLSHLQR